MVSSFITREKTDAFGLRSLGAVADFGSRNRQILDGRWFIGQTLASSATPIKTYDTREA